MLGYTGGFIGPLIIGWSLDMGGGMTPHAWALSFAIIALLSAGALVIFVAMRPRELAGDRQ
jgi:hypothetical protein